MHAIIETGGKQYRVAPGDVIRVEKLAGDVGSEIELPVKAAFNDGGELVPVAPVKAHHHRQRPRRQDSGLQVQAQEAVQEHHRAPPVLHGSEGRRHRRRR